MNIVKTGDGRFIEMQGTAEGKPFDERALDALMALADKGIAELIDLQRDHRRRDHQEVKLLVATTNPGKIREITLLEGLPVSLVTLGTATRCRSRKRPARPSPRTRG